MLQKSLDNLPNNSQFLPFLPTGALYNDRNHRNYAVTPWHQTYLLMTTNFDENRLVFGKL